MQFRAVIFDLDGTLLDTEALAIRAGMQAAKDAGLALDEAFFHQLIGFDGKTVAKAIEPHIGSEAHARQFKSQWSAHFAAYSEAGIPLKPGVTEFLDHLDRIGMPRAVATNSGHDGANRSLRLVGLLDRFHAVSTADRVARAKPAPDVYLAAAEGLGVAPGDCVAFEDSDLGAQAAHAAGMTVVQVPDIVAVHGRFAHHPAASVIAGARLAGFTV